jgi:hypothetical protein
MMSPCDHVLDRFAAGEALTADEQAHVTACVDCARLARVPGLLAAAAREPEPGPGFSARMQVGARGRLAARRRNRVALVAFATAAVVTAGTLAFTRPTKDVSNPSAILSTEQREPQPRPPVVAETPISDDDVAAGLVRVSDTEQVLAGEADWSDITRSLEPYRALLVKHGVRRGGTR